MDKVLAEILGIFAADGCMQANYLCIWGNLKEERDYYDNHLVSLFKKKFNLILKMHPKGSNSLHGFHLCDRKILNLFNQLGFHKGNKTYDLEVPQLVLENQSVYSDFIRGYFDGDGCLNFQNRTGRYKFEKKRYHYYPRLIISSVSKKIINQLCFMLSNLKLNILVIQVIEKNIANLMPI